MAFKSYLTINGKIHGEVTSGVATGYATDALGSVTATVDNSGNVANTYRYKPYGATLAKTGASTDPKNQWVGSWGYRVTGRTQSESYVRARHYGHKSGMWTTVDHIWPREPAYVYGRCLPVALFDYTGYAVDFSNSGCSSSMKRSFKSLCDKLKDYSKNKFVDVLRCMGYIDTKNKAFNEFIVKALYRLLDQCSGKVGTPKICVFCDPQNSSNEAVRNACSDICSAKSRRGITPIPLTGNESILSDATGNATKVYDYLCKEWLAPATPSGGSPEVCARTLEEQNSDAKCNSVVIICQKNGGGALTTMHELIHAIGIPGGSHHNEIGLGHVQDLVERIEACLEKKPEDVYPVRGRGF